MGSKVNIGNFRDRVTVSFVASQAVSAQGSRTPTYTDYDLFADVRQMSNDQAQLYGLDVMSDNFMVICRPPATGRPARVTYNSEIFRVIAAERDKVSQFLRMIITTKR